MHNRCVPIFRACNVEQALASSLPVNIPASLFTSLLINTRSRADTLQSTVSRTRAEVPGIFCVRPSFGFLSTEHSALRLPSCLIARGRNLFNFRNYRASRYTSRLSSSHAPRPLAIRSSTFHRAEGYRSGDLRIHGLFVPQSRTV